MAPMEVKYSVLPDALEQIVRNDYVRRHLR